MSMNKNDRNIKRFPKHAPLTSSVQNKSNPHLTPRLKSDLLNKQKDESFATPASRLKNKNRHNCLPQTVTPRPIKKTPSTLKIKSVSLIDLPCGEKHEPKTQRKTVSREHGDYLIPTSTVGDRSKHIFSFTFPRESELAACVCRKFILRAWRKSRDQTHSLQLVTKSLNKKVENLSIQNCVLKDLLESERKRVTLAMNELNHARNQVEDEQKISKNINERLTRREISFAEEKELWNSKELKQKERIESLKTELEIAVKNSLQLNEEMLSYKQNINNSKTNEDSLKEKLEHLQECLKDQTNKVNTLKNKNVDLQTAVEGLVTRNQELAREKENKENKIIEYINNIKRVQEELKNLKDIQTLQSSDCDKLRNDYESVKIQTTNKDVEIKCLQEVITLYEANEEKQLKNKLKTVAIQGFQLVLSLIPLPNYIL